MNYSELFLLGMKRTIKEPLDMPDGLILNLGAGHAVYEGAENLDLPGWNADKRDCLSSRYGPDSVAGIHAYHLLEHLQYPTQLLRECQHVLQPGGVMNIVVPYGHETIALQDLDHKHFFNEETWKTTFDNQYYDGHGLWKFQVHVNVIMGIVKRNLALFTQLVKVGS